MLNIDVSLSWEGTTDIFWHKRKIYSTLHLKHYFKRKSDKKIRPF